MSPSSLPWSVCPFYFGLLWRHHHPVSSIIWFPSGLCLGDRDLSYEFLSPHHLSHKGRDRKHHRMISESQAASQSAHNWEFSELCLVPKRSHTVQLCTLSVESSAEYSSDLVSLHSAFIIHAHSGDCVPASLPGCPKVCCHYSSMCKAFISARHVIKAQSMIAVIITVKIDSTPNQGELH